MAGVVELSYYPVKGCAGASAGKLLTPAGLAHDRRQGVARGDASGKPGPCTPPSPTLRLPTGGQDGDGPV
ncbi:hypothetical protein FHS32_001319 [Streptomyces albaduncus]|uniref:MOSC N-terminal beta barrel domain-containing protein n=1 Tax=Streptomyces griseoloalbus TaxID=67303 RepID=A0A7W8BKG0_9ACTN|nr:hypothetical protein [Streptomyces albaduncus]GGW38049.1 hypothetical protein GCM10010340_14590 [Streptomyces albaduncus]